MIKTFSKVLSNQDVNDIVEQSIINDNLYRYRRYGETFCICLIKFEKFNDEIFEEFKNSIRHIDKILFVGKNLVIVLLANTNELQAYQAMIRIETIFSNNNLMSIIIEKRDEDIDELIIVLNNKSIFLEQNTEYKNIFIIGSDI